jgi:cytidyltransferase-like protein
MGMKAVVVSGSFDDLGPRRMRFLHEASRMGELNVLLWSDEVARALQGWTPRFPQEERLYFMQSVRYVSRVILVTDQPEPDGLPSAEGLHPGFWAVEEAEHNERKQDHSRASGIICHVLTGADLDGYPDDSDDLFDPSKSRPKVIVTGCYDWLHSGHVRFFEEASQLGDLYVGVGHDHNLRQLKGEGHPMFPQEQRRYLVQSIRFVRRAFITSGNGWMDAEPEIARIRPDIYVVNEDGDVPEKRAFCDARGIRYVVLKRLPRQGLQMRHSTDLRGF